MNRPDQRNPTLVDMNNGLLSATSDGGIDWPRTLRFAKHAAESGVTEMVVTMKMGQADALMRRMTQLRSLLEQHSLELRVSPGMEMGLHSELFDHVIHTATVVGGLHRRYVLLRVMPDNPIGVTSVVDSLRSMGLMTILVSPERVERFRSDPSELKTIVRLGGRLQLSASSLLDDTDRKRVKFCKAIVRDGLCHCVASESGRHHDLPISLAEAWRVIAKWRDRKTADRLCRDNPRAVLEGRPIGASSRPKKRRLFFAAKSG